MSAPIIESLYKDKTDRCLGQFSGQTFELDDPNGNNLVYLYRVCLDRHKAKRKFNQSEYNAGYFRWASAIFDRGEFCGTTFGFEACGLGEQEFITNTAQSIDFLSNYGSEFLSEQLGDRLEKFTRRISLNDPTLNENKVALPGGEGRKSEQTANILSKCSAMTDEKEKLMCFEIAASLLNANQSSGTSAYSNSSEIKYEMLDAFYE